MGFGFVFFKKIDKHTLKNSKTNKNTPQNQQKKKKAQLLVTTVTGRMQEKVMEQTLW